jgi:hypothetical protein
MILDERLTRYLFYSGWTRDTTLIEYMTAQGNDIESYSRENLSYSVRQYGSDRKHRIDVQPIGLDVASVVVDENDDMGGFLQVSAAVASCIDRLAMDHIAHLSGSIAKIEKASRTARWIFSEVAETLGVEND